MYSRTSAIRTSETIEPRWGRMSTSPSACSRASASETGKRETPSRSQIGALVEDLAGPEASVTMACAQGVGDVRGDVAARRAGRTPRENDRDSASGFMLTC